MSNLEQVKGELAMALKLVAYKEASLIIPPMAAIDQAMKDNHWEPISAVEKGGSDTELSKFYYGTMQKTYAQVIYDCVSGATTIKAADESSILEDLDFEHLKVLGGLLDKKSVAFIRTYAEKEMSSAKTEEELNALNERNARMIEEAEVALRKR